MLFLAAVHRRPGAGAGPPAEQAPREHPVPVGELLTTGTRFLAPLILLLGVYVFVNGHLTPGGGFQGGAIIASGVLLLLLADPLKHFSHEPDLGHRSISGRYFLRRSACSACSLPAASSTTASCRWATLGALFSAGAIPLIYSLIGLKVGAEFASMLAEPVGNGGTLMAYMAMATGFLLILIGAWGALTNRNLLRMIVAFTIADTGVNLVIIAVGYMRGRTAPILDSAVAAADAVPASSTRCRRRWCSPPSSSASALRR